MANPAAVTTAAATSEVINSFLLFKIRAFESIHLNLIVYPSKMMCLRCDSFLNRRPAPSSSVIEPDSDGYGREGNKMPWGARIRSMWLVQQNLEPGLPCREQREAGAAETEIWRACQRFSAARMGNVRGCKS